MVILDIKMPKTCAECSLMRCGYCVASASRTVSDYPKHMRPTWCPIVGEVDRKEDK